jgi:xanthine/CO dehydrogenase XdhC/CoxF family maturation factor
LLTIDDQYLSPDARTLNNRSHRGRFTFFDSSRHLRCQETLTTGTPALVRYGVSDDEAFEIGLTCGAIDDQYLSPDARTLNNRSHRGRFTFFDSSRQPIPRSRRGASQRRCDVVRRVLYVAAAHADLRRHRFRRRTQMTVR